jgi:hypothetical protein
MRSTQKLKRMLRDLLMLVDEEAARNSSFADRLAAIMDDLSITADKKPARQRQDGPSEPVPDVLAVYQEKGADEFLHWLRSLDLTTLKAIVKTNGFDAGKASQRWKEPDKFADLILTQTAARLRRGSAFLPLKPSTDTKTNEGFL